MSQQLTKAIQSNESVAAWCDSLVYQMNNMNYAEQSKYLAGPIALCKAQTTDVSHLVGGICSQIGGGRSLTKSGMGKFIESFQRAVLYSAILGGSTPIMNDLGMKQAMKNFPKVQS